MLDGLTDLTSMSLSRIAVQLLRESRLDSSGNRTAWPSPICAVGSFAPADAIQRAIGSEKEVAVAGRG
jgi:hypothetical protein